MKIDWKLKGSNLLRFGCGKDVTVHPKTCSDVVLMGHNGSQSLTDWITKDTEAGLGTSLTDWITNSFVQTVGDDIVFEINADYTPSSDSWDYANSMLLGRLNNVTDIRIPYGSIGSYGVFKVGEGLQATNGVLALKAATNSTYGGIKLFGTGDALPEGGVPVQLSNGKAYIDLSGGIQSDCVIYKWDEYNPTHTATTPAINPSAYIVNEDADNFSSINIYNYIRTIKDLFHTSVNEYRIYPVRTDTAGHLYTFVPWINTTYNVYSNNSTVGAGLVPYDSDSSIDSTAFLGKDGRWKVPSYTNLQNKPTVYVGINSGFVPRAPSTGLTTKYLRADGAWVTPPNDNTTYSADNKSVFMNTGNIFYDPHQYSITTIKHGAVANHLDFTKFRKIDYKVVGLPADASAVTDLSKDLFNILENITRLPENGSTTITYGYDYDDVLSWVMDSGSEFISQYKNGNIKLNIYGDIVVVADDSSNLPSSVSSLTFYTSTASTNTHHDITFSFVTDGNQIDLTIVCIKNVAVTIR